MDNITTEIIEILSRDFPNPKSELNFNSPFELLCAVILSAQCTDKRVNIVTPTLFAVADTPQSMCQLPLEQIEQIVHSCGFYKHKAKFLREASTDIVTRFNGVVPSNLQDLETLSGVGRKTANVVYAVGFGGQAIAVDTHVFRVSNRLGLAHAKNVLETEKQLMAKIDKRLWRDCHHYILLQGRYVCHSQRPDCANCHLCKLCEYYQNKVTE